MSPIKIVLIIMLGAVLNYSCDECEVKECKTTISGRQVTVTANVSGGGGTQITPDSISEVTSQSAKIAYVILREGACHKIIGYGHVSSATDATPTLENSTFSDYGDNVNFNDQVKTTMNGLLPATRYFVRSWVAIEISDCDKTREIMYNDAISEFTTNP
jgi:hypothetical protein